MMFKHLLLPTSIGRLELKNKIVMAPLGTGFFDHGFVTERVKNFYLARAMGGVGLIITGAAFVTRPINGKGAFSICHPHFYDDKFIPGWKDLINEVHKFNSKIGIQLFHPGRQITITQWGELPVSSSAIPCPVVRVTPRELDVEEILELVRFHVAAAVRAKEAGFDLVEIHGAHGYLGTQFLSPYMNKRNDEYGGDIKGRTRFIREILQGIKKIVGHEFVVGVRYNGQDNIEGGMTLKEAKEIGYFLQSDGADFLHISATVYAGYPPISPMAEPAGCYISLAEAVKGAVKVPVIGVGKINTPELAEKIVKENRADLIAIGRPLLADPEWVNKAARGESEKIRKCIYCNQGCLDRIDKINLEGKVNSITCLLNPEVGREMEFKLRPARNKKRVLVAGGGPAGLEAARVAAARGHKVILYEKDNKPGGQFRLASLPPTKQDYKEAIDYLVKDLKNLGVEIKLGCTCTIRSVNRIKPDVVIVATGANPTIPEISGVENEYVITYYDVLSGKAEVGKKVLVIGGGLVGLETADFLSAREKSVQVVEMLDRLGSDMGKVAWFGLKRRLNAKNVKLFKSCKVTEIYDQKVKVIIDGQKKTLGVFDTIILSVGCQPRNSLAEEIRGIVTEVYVIGDALKPRKALEAIYDGAIVGRKI